MASGNTRTGKLGVKTARDAARQRVNETVADIVSQKLEQALEQHLDKHADKQLEKKLEYKTAKLQAKLLGRAADRVEACRDALPHDLSDFWTNTERGRRQPKLSRATIAQTAINIADFEGFDAVSMRRIAAELGVGTMSLYHYVRTKDELLMVIFDEFLGEVVVPENESLPSSWIPAITLIAKRSRDAIRRHPWILDISDDPRFGPNAMLHFDQSWSALNSMTASVEFKIDVVMTVDEYVFGYCLHERNNFTEGGEPSGMVEYISDLAAISEYPAINQIANEIGIATFWTTIHQRSRDPQRFDTNLARLLDGFAAALDNS